MRKQFTRWRPIVLGIVLIVVTIAIYRPAWHGGFLWDDDAYVTKNRLLTAPDGLQRIWFSLDAPSQYFPLTYTTFRIERGLWDLNPTGYHWVNILLHVINALLVWALLARLKIPGAWLAAAIFALHPVQVESVAWIAERKNVLMGCFFLLTLLAWCAFLDRSGRRGWIFYGLAVTAYLAALSAKTTACTLPAALLLILWWEKRPIDSRRLVQIVPFAGLGLMMGLITIWWERFHQGTRGALFTLGPLERLLVASRALWFYLGKLFWPINLTFIYPQWRIDVSDPRAYFWIVACTTAVVVIYLMRRRFGRGPEVAALFFTATLAPVLGFIMLYTFRYTYVADHYQYLACLGPIALVSVGFVMLSERGGWNRFLGLALALLLLVTLATLTCRQTATYRDIETLWKTTIARNPGCWMAYNNLGITFFDRGETDKAVSNYRKSIELKSDFAQTHYNLANALLQKGEVEEAFDHGQTALRLRPNDPDTHIALGNALLAKGTVDEALAEYQKALDLRPNDPEALYGLANASQGRGDLDSAKTLYEQALQIAPDLFEAHLNLGNILLQKKRLPEAISHYEKAFQIAPRSEKAQANLAWALSAASEEGLRNGPRAVRLAEQANATAGGGNPLTLHTLAAAYAANGQFTEAVRTAERALKLAQADHDQALVAELEREIGLYEQGKAYQEP